MSRLQEEAFVESFESYRPYLFAIAYRMLGSAMDGEDMVQETYLRYQTRPPETIRSLKMTRCTVVAETPVCRAISSAFRGATRAL
jgi:hypothetical protein